VKRRGGHGFESTAEDGAAKESNLPAVIARPPRL
jgi:hypothetical protein